MFDFKSAQEQAKKQLNNKALFAMVMGPSGAGKSTCIGTLKGKTLFLYCSGESHGPKTAAAFGGDVTPVCIDFDDTGKELSADEAMTRLADILADAGNIKKAGFANVAIDGASEVEALFLRSRRFVESITTDKGKLNEFKKGESISMLFREVVVALKKAHAIGINCVMTCRVDVRSRDDDGTINEAAPKLLTFSVAEALTGAFDDVLLVGPVTIGGKFGYAFQFGDAQISRTAKDAAGVVRKYLNFSPRVTGVREIPAVVKSDLEKILELKNPKAEEKK
jgi:energy-coupling factor transporter ATP-binding protein EcfA2